MKSQKLAVGVSLLGVIGLAAVSVYYYSVMRAFRKYESAFTHYPPLTVPIGAGSPYSPAQDRRHGEKALLEPQITGRVVVLTYHLATDCNALKPMMEMAQHMPAVLFVVYFQRVDACSNTLTPKPKNLLLRHDPDKKVWHNLRVQWTPRVYVIDKSGKIAYVQPISENLETALLVAKRIAQDLQNR